MQQKCAELPEDIRAAVVSRVSRTLIGCDVFLLRPRSEKSFRCVVTSVHQCARSRSGFTIDVRDCEQQQGEGDQADQPVMSLSKWAHTKSAHAVNVWNAHHQIRIMDRSGNLIPLRDLVPDAVRFRDLAACRQWVGVSGGDDDDSKIDEDDEEKSTDTESSDSSQESGDYSNGSSTDQDDEDSSDSEEWNDESSDEYTPRMRKKRKRGGPRGGPRGPRVRRQEIPEDEFPFLAEKIRQSQESRVSYLGRPQCIKCPRKRPNSTETTQATYGYPFPDEPPEGLRSRGERTRCIHHLELGMLDCRFDSAMPDDVLWLIAYMWKRAPQEIMEKYVEKKKRTGKKQAAGVD